MRCRRQVDYLPTSFGLKNRALCLIHSDEPPQVGAAVTAMRLSNRDARNLWLATHGLAEPLTGKSDAL